MKTLFCIALFFIVSEGFSQKVVSITLHESTRGFRREITITEKEYILDENSIIFKKKLTSEEWRAMLKICDKIKWEELANFNSSSNKRAKDGALHAYLRVKIGRKKYESSFFDHDNPPKELSVLINELRKL